MNHHWLNSLIVIKPILAKSILLVLNTELTWNLRFEEIIHCQKMIVALTETDRLMKEVDSVDFLDGP